MSILDHLPRRPSRTAHLDTDHAHRLLDALTLAERMIEPVGPLLGRHTRQAARVYASLSLYCEPADTEAGDRSPRVLVDLLDTTGLSDDAGPVRGYARTTDTDTSPAARPPASILELSEAGR